MGRAHTDGMVGPDPPASGAKPFSGRKLSAPHGEVMGSSEINPSHTWSKTCARKHPRRPLLSVPSWPLIPLHPCLPLLEGVDVLTEGEGHIPGSGPTSQVTRKEATSPGLSFSYLNANLKILRVSTLVPERARSLFTLLPTF